jgi:cytosine/adenosine deaminase-related metal-dependent hydrolase
VSGDLWEAIKPYFANRVVSIHNQETAFEDEFFLQGTGDFGRMYQLMNIDNAHHRPTGKSSLQSYIDQLNAARSAILVHNTFTTQTDIDYLQGSQRWFQPHASFCLCVNANLYIENALPPVELLRANNCSIVLGTDSLASNHSLSIADEMKTIRKHFPHIPLAEMLQWATANGAKALGMDDVFGSFEPGKQPGVVVMNESLEKVCRVI